MRLYQLLKTPQTKEFSVWCDCCQRFRPLYSVLVDLDGPSFVYQCPGDCSK
jgi:hypothetical protein